MEKITIQSLNALFDHVQSPESTVLWIRNLNGDKQLYLSPQFEEIWGVKSDLIFENPINWLEYLHDDDRERLSSHVTQRHTQPDVLDKDETYYRILGANHQLNFMKSHSLLLTDDEARHVGFAGITTQISEQQWSSSYDLSEQKVAVDPAQSQYKKYVFEMLRNELRLNMSSATNSANAAIGESCVLMHNGRPVNITAREMQCLYYTSKGKSAKVTASILNISPRTVEFHINNLKLKAECRTKLELLSKTIIK